MKKPLVYIAGPFTKPDPLENMHKACKLATRLVQSGLITPFVPHLTGAWHLVDPQPYHFWLNMDFEIIERCDAVFRMPGESAGADRETALALSLDIPVFHDYTALMEWARQEVRL